MANTINAPVPYMDELTQTNKGQQMSFNHKNLKELRPKITAALQELAKAEGISIQVIGSASFSDSNVTFKLSCSTVNKDGTVNSQTTEDFKNYCPRYGLKPEALGTTFTRDRQQYTITGCKPRASKYPIIGQRNGDGKSFKFSPEDVKRCLDDKSLIKETSPPQMPTW